MELFQDEKKLLKAGGDRVLLTTHRLRFEHHPILTSIFLKDIASIQVNYIEKTQFLIGGIIAWAVGLISLSTSVRGSGVILILAGSAMIGWYFWTRKHVVSVATAGDAVVFQVKGFPWNSITSFVERVEKAKRERIEQTTETKPNS